MEVSDVSDAGLFCCPDPGTRQAEISGTGASITIAQWITAQSWMNGARD